MGKMYRKYYSYNDMPTIAQHRENTVSIPKAEKKEPERVHKEEKHTDNGLFQNGKLFGKFESDDIILLIVVFILLMDECDDKLLLAALAFIFFNGF